VGGGAYAASLVAFRDFGTAAQRRPLLSAVTRARKVEFCLKHASRPPRSEERYSAAEARWLTEVDRARQLAKEAAKEHERQNKELRDRLGSVQNDRDQIHQELIEARPDLKTATAVREQLEERVRVMSGPSVRTSATGRPHRKQPRKPKSATDRRRSS
jgi:hypothetical protein